MKLGSASSVDTTELLGLTRQFANTLENLEGFTDDQIKAGLNQSQRRLQSFILSEVMKEWRDDGSDLNGTGVGSIDLVRNQNNYSFPTNLIMIDRVEINYSGDTNGYKLATPKRMSEIPKALNNTANFNNIQGSKRNPVYYVRGNEIFIDPIPDLSVTGGIKVYGVTKITDLTLAADEPIFEETFQEILCMDTALKYLVPKGKDQLANRVKTEMNELKMQMVKFYSNRQNDKRRGLKARVKNYR